VSNELFTNSCLRVGYHGIAPKPYI